MRFDYYTLFHLPIQARIRLHARRWGIQISLWRDESVCDVGKSHVI